MVQVIFMTATVVTATLTAIVSAIHCTTVGMILLHIGVVVVIVSACHRHVVVVRVVGVRVLQFGEVDTTRF